MPDLVSGRYSHRDSGDAARSVLFAAGASDHVTVAQAREVAGVKAMVAPLTGTSHEIFAFDPQLAAEGDVAFAQVRMERMVWAPGRSSPWPSRDSW